MTTIRLPLQIGTSALWSLARSSVFFPGILLVGLGIYALIELWDLDKVAFAIAGALVLSGALFVYYAYRHARLALDERPSDVVLDDDGIRIEGGARHGLSLAWKDIEPAGCAVADEIEERLVLWRMVVDIPLMAIAVLGESGELMLSPTQKTPIKRLYVKTNDGERLLVAEGDTPVEQESLAALIATIRSPRWYGKAPLAKAKPAVITCSHCGASIAPSPHESVQCPFCDTAVHMPEDVRTKVRAAMELGRTRRAGLRHLGRLLASQPSAARASIAIWIAAIPIALGWPIAIWFAVRGWEMTAAGEQRLLLLSVFPLLLTFGAFLLARGRLTDRFALHAVVVGFGARDPERPGEPYRCRACEAALPPAAEGTPVVRCVYCKQESVLGLDLRIDATEAAEEHASLAVAMRKRTRERWLWTVGSALSFALFALAYVTMRPSLAAVRAPRTPEASRRLSDGKAPASVASVAPAPRHSSAPYTPAPAWSAYAAKAAVPYFPDVTRTAVVKTKVGAVPFTTKTCDLIITPSGLTDLACRVRLLCGGAIVFGIGETGYEPCEMADGALTGMTDSKPTPVDKDPKLTVDLAAATATLGDVLPNGQTYTVSFHLQPPE
jgi:hypothetical protein